jgi:hypothetical protein
LSTGLVDEVTFIDYNRGLQSIAQHMLYTSRQVGQQRDAVREFGQTVVA